MDPVFPPPLSESMRARYAAPVCPFENNKFSLVYDSYFEQAREEEAMVSSEKEGCEE